MTAAITPDHFAPSDSFDPFAGPALATAVPSTAAQREIWAATWMGDDASLAYNEAVVVRLRGRLDEQALRAGVRDVVARHEALRATFSADGAVLAIAEADGDVPVARHDWRALPVAEREAAWQALRARVVAEPFDLLRGPLVRFELARFANDDCALVITAHHIICDGWSFGVLVPELAAAYSAQRAGHAAELPPADSFAAYAEAAEHPDAREASETAARYWLSQFAGGAPVLDLPTDRPRPSTRHYAAGRVDHALGADLVRRVTQAGARVGASQFATLFGAFGMLLHRLGAGEDLVVGVPAAGQPSCGMPRLVGHLVSMLPVRLRYTADMPARDALAHARGQVLDAYDHQALTFGGLLARLPLARDPGRPPLVSVAFNLDKGLDASALPFAGLTASVHSVPRSRENFDLFVNAVEVGGTMTVECQYNTALYDEATVCAWLAAYECLLDGIAAMGPLDVATIDATVGSLPVTTAAADETVTAGPVLALPARPLVHRLVEEQVVRTPHVVAVGDGTRTLTYGELDARANQLARHLRARGVRRGAFVGLCLERTVDMFVAVLAVLKTGGAYVPLDPGHPVDRLAYVADDAGITLLLTEESVRATTPLMVADVVSIDGADAAAIIACSDAPLAAAAHTNPDAAVPDGPAYVIYTSGSTGRPKGVVVLHRAVVNLLLSVQQTPGMTADDVVLAITTLAFDIAVSETILPLTVGARVVLASRDVAADGLQLRALIEREGVTFIDATPATYRLLLAAGWNGGPQLRLICTGEAMPRDVGDELCARAGEVWNGYGPTETTVWSTFWRVTAPVGRVLIGRPIANTRAYVLDARRQPVPVGVRGELFLGGAGVTNGYLGRAELTAERFLADPFVREPGARMYRTGDVVRLLADGTLECLGRNDTQVKLRGYRIELGEIESQVGTCPGVGSCAVVVREDRPDDRRLVAYVTGARGDGAASAPSDAELRAHLKTALPDYMIPQTFVCLPALPLTPSGKIDRAALPAPETSALARVPTTGRTFVEPRTPTERLIAALWADALRVARVSATDDFFQLGGHSLMAAQVLGRLRRDHGVELAYRRIFEAPTVEQFASLVAGALGGAGDAAIAAAAGSAVIPHDPTRMRAPLTALQHRLWRLEELDPATAVTHVHGAAWRLVGDVDPAEIEGALDDFVSRHDQLRTRFELENGVPVQVVDPDARISVTRIDLSALAAAEREAAITVYITEQGATPFDLGVAPLFRAALITTAPGEHLLYTVRHGMIWDGWSFDIFITELCELLEARVVGRAPVLPALPITLGDFAAWQQTYLTSPEMDRQVAWWRAYLGDDLPTLELPTDRPRPAQATYAGDNVHVTFTADEVERLTTLAHAHGATLYILLLSAYNALLHRYSGQRDILVGTPVRARTWPETEPVIGAFVNTVLLRFDVDPAAPFTELLGRVRDVTLDAFGHQDMPIELLGGKVPALRALFSMQDARARPRAAADICVEQVHVPHTAATNDLMLWTMSMDDGMRAVLNFSTDLFERATAERFLAHLRTMLRAVLDDPCQTVGRLPLLTTDELHSALGASDPYPPSAVGTAEPTRNLIAAIVAVGTACPDAVAVSDSVRGAITYGQLLTRAESVRVAVMAAGVGAGVRVAVLADDVASRAAALLGVRAAHGAVLLLDTRDPAAYNGAIAASAGVTHALVTADAARAFGTGVLRIALDTLAPATTTLTVDEDISGSDEVAVLLHDVGTSGEAATTALSQVSLDALATDIGARLGVTATTVAVPLHSPAAPGATLEMLVPLASGAMLAVAPDDAEMDGTVLSRFLQHVGATLVVAPGATWRELETAPWDGDARFTALVTDGATPALLATIARRARRVVATHGHAAAGLWSAAAVPDVRTNTGRVAYGVPLAGARLFVLDDRDEVAAPGVPGWLHVAGPAVDAASRLNAADPRFTDDLRTAGARAFRTGERARRGADGRIEILATEPARLFRHGRVFGLEAVAAALRGHPSIADAAVTGRDDDAGEARPVACVSPMRGATYTETELRRHVRAVLPEAVVPQHFVDVDEIVRDAQGVVLWNRLPITAPWEASRPMAVPTTASELYVAALWQELLGTSNVRNTDKFFDLGGHSLLCFRFIDRVTREQGVRVNPRIVLLGTLEQIAAEIDAPRAAPGVTPLDLVASAAPIVGHADTPAPTSMFGRIRRLLGGVA